MKRRANATLIGAFVVAGLLVLAAAAIALAGGTFFAHKDSAMMYFKNSVYGLQVGAPVVFRGVRVGSVSSIRVVFDDAANDFLIPVGAELQRDALRGLDGKKGADVSLAELVDRGLSARLSMQSLLTGQLYVDLDLRPDQPPHVHDPRRIDIVIPTSPTTIQTIKNQLDNIDFHQLVEDVSTIASSAKAMLAGPQLKQALDDLQQITGNVKRLTAALEQRIGPLSADAHGALTGTQRAMDRLGTAADGVAATARTLDGASQQLSVLLAPDSPLMRDLRHSADELARAAAALRQTTAPDSAVMRDADRALQDVSRAARALRELSELLERHPDALVRGRPPGD